MQAAPTKTEAKKDLHLLESTINLITEKTKGNPITAIFLKRMHRKGEIFRGFDQSQLYRMYYGILIFFRLIGITWLVAAQNNES